MAEGRSISLALLLMGFLFVIPILGVAVIVVVRRSTSMRHLSRGIILSGLTAAILTACFGITRSTAPIAPYEAVGDTWASLLGPLLIFLYVGFGLGSVAAALIAIPVSLLSSRIRSRAGIQDQPPPHGQAGESGDERHPG